MGILAGVGHDRFSPRWNDRLGDHAPAGIRDELNPEPLELQQNPGFLYLVVRCAPAGHNNQHVLMLRTAAAEGSELFAFANGEMRIAERYTIDR